MRKSLLLMSAAALGLAMPAMAQDTSPPMANPPAANSSQSMPEPANNMPAGTAAMPNQPGMGNEQGNMTGMQPMRHPRHHHMAHRRSMNRETGEITPATGAGPGEPESRRPSNIDRADTRSGIAPALPMPPVRVNSPEGYLAAADRALARHQGGAAQEALERAETRLLDRSVPAGEGNMPEHDPRLTQIHDARMALANHDWNAARQNIQQAMNMRGGMGMNHGNMNQGQMMGQPALQPGMNQPGMNQGDMNQPLNQPRMAPAPPPNATGVVQ